MGLNFLEDGDDESMRKSNYKWATLGDLNAFFALFFDNVVNLFILAEILVSFGFPREFIYTKIIPGTALGVLIGDLIYTWLAFRLAKQNGRTGITAMPLGIDMPSTVGIAIIVLGPSFLVLKESLGNVEQAALYSWYIGIGVMLWMGVIKTVCAFLGPYIQRVVPSAGMVGSIAGIGLVWLGAQGIIGVYELPFVGLLSLVIIVFTLIGHFDFPLKIPGAAAAVLVGTLVYYGMGLSGALEGMNLAFTIPGLDGLGLHLPLPQLEGLKSMFGLSLNFLPMAIPLSILVFSVSINIVEAARLMGDTYHPRTIILTDALATFAAGICGGVAQSTPYFGHSAYKRMGAHAGYTLAAGLAVGLGGMFGMIGFFVDLIPGPAIKPILIFIGFDMIRLTFNLTPPRHIMAAVFAIVPSILNFTYVKLKSLYGHAQEAFSALQMNAETAAATAMANGLVEKKRSLAASRRPGQLAAGLLAERVPHPGHSRSGIHPDGHDLGFGRRLHHRPQDSRGGHNHVPGGGALLFRVHPLGFSHRKSLPALEACPRARKRPYGTLPDHSLRNLQRLLGLRRGSYVNVLFGNS